jgi:DNA polymerase I-like protein with 3'-5' exonuclease and polymerase domains
LLIFDTETNGLLYEATHFHVLVIYNTHTDRTWVCHNNPNLPRDTTLEDGLSILINQGAIIAGHNICGFDIPAIEKLTSLKVHSTSAPNFPGSHFESISSTGGGVLDTFMLSCLLWPQRYEHGLEAWGEEFGVLKPSQEQWHTLDEAMINRCVSDVRINTLLMSKILDKLTSLHEDGINMMPALGLEQDIQLIHAQQELTGVRVDIHRAVDTMKQLDVEIAYLTSKIQAQAPKVTVETHKGTPVRKPFLKNGGYSKMVTDWFGSASEAAAANVRGEFSRIRFDPINLDSDVQVKNYLLSIGWKPTQWNIDKKTRKRTSPKLTEDSYGSLPPGIGQDIARFNIITHRRGMICNRKGKEKGILWNLREADGRVPAEAYTCGTPTSRYRHKKSVCNIPRPGSPLGEEIRGIFCVPDKWWMLGMDLKGIEIRMIAHYCMKYPGGNDMANLILSGDFHDRNATIWDVSRNDGKSGLYALCYGCTPPKLAETLNKPQHLANTLFEAFWSEYPPLRQLVDDLNRAYKARRCLIGLDGRRLSIREDRKLLNTLIQGGSAVVFKQWMRRCHQIIEAKQWTSLVQQLIAYHDELQFEIRNSNKAIAEDVGTTLCDLAVDVGKSLGIKVPIEADMKVGKNWAETH